MDPMVSTKQEPGSQYSKSTCSTVYEIVKPSCMGEEQVFGRRNFSFPE